MSRPVPPFRARGIHGIIALFISATCYAQAPGELDRVVEFHTAFDDRAAKFIYEGVTDQDPGAFIHIDRAVQEVLLRLHVELDTDEFQTLIGQSGLQISYYGAPRPEIGPVRMAACDGTIERPIFRHTGRREADNARYDLQLKVWNAVHPGADPIGTHHHDR